MRKGLFQGVPSPDDNRLQRIQDLLKVAIETLSSDDDILRIPATYLTTTAAIASGASVVWYTGAPAASLTLPRADAQGSTVSAIVLVANRSTGAISVKPVGADTLNSLKTLSLASGSVLVLVSDGISRWFAGTIGGGAGAGSLTDFTQALGSAQSGHFDITGLSGLTAGKNVVLVQTAQPIASKGGARDEFEMDNIQLTGYVVDASTIRCYWQAPSIVVGTFAFAYQVAA